MSAGHDDRVLQLRDADVERAEREQLCSDGMLGVPKSARFLDCGESKVWKLVREGRLPVVRIDRRTLIPKRALVRFLAERLERME